MAKPLTGEGVEIRDGSIRLVFRYKGTLCRPTLKRIKPTKTNIKYAKRVRGTILEEIARGTFDWRKYFDKPPGPPGLFPIHHDPLAGKTVNDFLDDLAAFYDAGGVGRSTAVNYKRKMKKIRRRFGKLTVPELTPSDVRIWRMRDLVKADGEHLSSKTVNEVLIPFRTMLQNIRKDLVAHLLDVRQIDAVLGELTSEEVDNSEQEPDPYTLDELKRIAATPTRYRSELNAFLFACHSGLSLSETLAYGWEDLDLAAGKGICRRAKVLGEYKVPKTRRRRRELDHLDQALEILRDQKALTYMRSPVDIQVLQRDNRLQSKEKHRPVFLSTITGKPMSPTYYRGFLEKHIAKAGVRWRGPNSARHTFISRMLTIGLPKEWIAQQAGHANTRMIDKHYGKWIREDRPDVARQASQLLNQAKEGSLK